VKTSVFLRTKFLIPQPASDRLPRPHLIDWLENQLDRRLILLSAPPGYGKTTLLADFLNAYALPAAWLQLDAADNDPSVFLACLIEAMRLTPSQTGEALGQTALLLLDSAEVSISPQQVLTVFINELTEIRRDSWLVVLEDYHFVANPVIHQMVNLLLENGPANLHLIISTRADPPLALARLRARGMLAELRTEDLRFREDEISSLLAGDIPDLLEQSVTLLSEKTEGWAAALQIMRSTLSGQDAGSAARLIASLNGSHRYIFEYLAGEVFRYLRTDGGQCL
jgi:LuxR family maltose regulon positive regulatory protein